MKEVVLDTAVKRIGRTVLSEKGLWMALSGSGAEFCFTGGKAVVTLLGDSTVNGNEENMARVAVFADGDCVADVMMDAPEKRVSIESQTKAACHVQVIKLTESPMSTVVLSGLAVEDEAEAYPAEDREHLIEFVGDSITCGYGVEDENPEHHFKTATENVRKAYAYRTAQKLKADYSMVSFSGYGIISGYTADGKNKLTNQRVPLYYDKPGFSYGNFEGKQPQEFSWKFTGRKPELVVINLGTNDDSYTLEVRERQEEFCREYQAFLKTIRKYNPGAMLLCVLGIMGTRLCPWVQKAVGEYRQETGDTKISYMGFEEQRQEDGRVADWHPTECTHEKAAEKLSRFIKTLMGWETGKKLSEKWHTPWRKRKEVKTMKYDVIIVGAGPGGIFTAYELLEKNEKLKIAVFEAGHALEKRRCPIDGDKVKSCIKCKSCAIMSGFGGAGAFSDGKYNITNDFGGTLFEYIGKNKALELMQYVDKINMEYGGEGTKMYSTAGSKFDKLCMQNQLKLLSASVRHLGTDINYVVLENLYSKLKEKVDFFFDCPVENIEVAKNGYRVTAKDTTYDCEKCVISVGRSGSKWMETVCDKLQIPTRSNRVDIGVRVEIPAVIFSHLTDELYESKIVYRTEKFEDRVRTFCMNPHGIVVNENTNGIVTVNGHSYEDPKLQTENTNFALLVAKHFSEPFKDSNGYGESIARLSNMLGGGVIVQRFGDLVRGRRSNEKRIEEGLVRPTLAATPGDLSLVLPKRILDGIIEMIYALDKIAPGTANDDTLLYGVEVKFYNMEVELNENLETRYPGLYVIGDGSGVTHSLSHASASGVFVARKITE